MGNEFFSGEFELAKQPVQGSMLFAPGGKIGHGMQTGFKEIALTEIVGVQAAGQVVLLNYQGFLPETG